MRAICQYFIRQKLHSMISSLFQIILHVLAAARHASVIIGIEFTVGQMRMSPLERVWKPEVGGKLACQREKGNPNKVKTVSVKADSTKTLQIKHNDNLYSFQSHFIMNFILSQISSWPG